MVEIVDLQSLSVAGNHYANYTNVSSCRLFLSFSQIVRYPFVFAIVSSLNFKASVYCLKKVVRYSFALFDVLGFVRQSINLGIRYGHESAVESVVLIPLGSVDPVPSCMYSIWEHFFNLVHCVGMVKR